MKKFSVPIIYLILICAFVFPASAEPVKSDAAILAGKARLKAQKRFWKSKPDMAPRTPSRGEEYSILKHRELKHKGRVIAHVLDLSPEGCIILSSDTDIHPVIAYSFKGKFLMEDAQDNAFLHLLQLDMGNRLDALPATSEKLKEKNSALWESYLAQEESFVQELSSEDVWGPWLQTTWHQGYPYKTFCPIDPTTGNRSVVGCAATAMAQIVNFWKHPTSLTFSWDEDHYISNEGEEKEIKIDDDHETLDFPSFDELNQRLVDIKYDGNVDEIAAICFACGISVSMNYSSQGSGTYASCVFSGYWRLGYSYVDKWMYEEDFYDVLKEDMKEARPAQLHIYSSSSGHAIVADGYRTNWAGESGDFYHLNFGWGESRPDLIDECWYTLPEGLPSGYNRVGSAAMNIYPSEGPVAYSQSVTTDEDTPVGMILTASDPDGDPLTYTIVTQPTKGTLSGTAPHLVYTPAPNLNGTDSFTFKASDGASDSNVATVSITVKPVNDPPVITSTPVTTATEGVLYTYDVEATDVDTGDVLTYSLTASPTGMSIDAATGLIQWTPASDQTGDNEVSVQIEDASEATDTQAFIVAVMNVNAPPVAYSQSVAADEDTPVGITLTASDPDGDPLTYTVVIEPASGTLTGTAPNLVYTPDPNLNGTDSFAFKVSDGTTDSDLAIVVITVSAGSLVIQAFNSVDLLITDPKGREIGKGISTISSAKYTEADMDGDGIPDDQVIIPKPRTGNYSIQVVSESGAEPNDTYTLDVTYGHKLTKLADKVKIKDIPGKPYIFLLTQSFSCKMKPGWSLISFPLQPLDTDPGVVLSSIDGKYSSVRAYDPDTGWSVYAPGAPGDLYKMEAGAGYWIEMDRPGTLTVEGTDLDSTAIFLKGGGWNLVGYNSLEPKNAEDCMRYVEDDIKSVWEFSVDIGWSVYEPYGVSDLSLMKPGCGYWMDVYRDCIWDANANTPAAAAAPPLTVRSRMSDVSSDRPEIPYSIWGNVEIDDENILRRGASAILKVDGKVESSCKLRTEDRHKYSYVLHVPAIADSSAQVCIQIGDKLVQAAPVPPGEPGQLIRLDLSVRDTPGVNFLYQNYPNPFNPDTWIPYQLKEDASVVIRIYALSGQLVRILNLGRKKAGSYTLRSRAAHWDGKNEVGEHVPSGIYFYIITAGDFSATRKMVVRK